MPRFLMLCVALVTVVLVGAVTQQSVQAADGSCFPWDLCDDEEVASGYRTEGEWTSEPFWIGPTGQEIELDLGTPGATLPSLWAHTRLALLFADTYAPVPDGEIVMCLDGYRPPCDWSVKHRVNVDSGVYRLRLEPSHGDIVSGAVEAKVTYNRALPEHSSGPISSGVWSSGPFDIGPGVQEVELDLGTPGAAHPLFWKNSSLTLRRAGTGETVSEIVMCDDWGEDWGVCADELVVYGACLLLGIPHSICIGPLAQCVVDNLEVDTATCDWSLQRRLDVDPGAYVLEVSPSHGDVLTGDVEGKIRYNRELDPPDDICMSDYARGQYNVAPAYPLWGHLEFGGDSDWHTVIAPVTGKMLVAMNVAGAAESSNRDFDLDVSGADCSGLLASARNDAPGALGAERALVDVAQNSHYRTRVFGHTGGDYMPPAVEADYAETVWFGNINNGFRLQQLTTAYQSKCRECGPAGQYVFKARFRNNPTIDFRDLTLHVTSLTGGNSIMNVTVWSQEGDRVVLDVDDADVRGAGATVSVPNYLLCHDPWVSALCRLDENDSFTVMFKIALATSESFDFAFDFYGTPVLELAAADAGAELDLELSGPSLEFVSMDPLSTSATLGDPLYLPALAK